MPDRPHEPGSSPTDAALARAAETLRQRGDVRGLICLIEAWSDLGEVPIAYRLLQVEALLDLCQTDRAWVRLKDLVEGDAPDPRALKLAGAMFIQRGWPQRARKPLELAHALLPDDPEVAHLLERARNPDSEIVEPPEGDDLDEVLPIAEKLLSKGHLLKGQSLLERLRRAHPDNGRVADLLWALAADCSLGHGSLAAFLQSLGEDPSDEFPEEPDLTEVDDATPVADLPGPDEDAADDESDFIFPALFRNLRDPAQDARNRTPVGGPPGFDDVTQSTNLADLAEIRDAVDAARRAAGFVGGEEFTEIRRVIRRPDGSTALGEALGTQTIPDSPFADPEGDLPLRARAPRLDVDVEAEDDALIIVTKREGVDGDAELLDLDPNTEAAEHPDAARFFAEAEEIARREAEEAEQARRRAERDAAIAAARTRGNHRKGRPPLGLTAGWLAAIAVLGLTTLVLFAFVLILFGVV